jgi:hypothetical protein
MVYKKNRRPNYTKKKYRGGQLPITTNNNALPNKALPINALPNKAEYPTMIGNFKKATSIGVQGLNTLISYGIDKVAESIGENPNESLEQTLTKVSNKLNGLKTVIQSPAGKKILYDISIIIKELGHETLVPAFDELSGVVVTKSGEIGKQVLKTGLDVVGVVPVAGEVVEAIRSISDVIRAGEQVVETGAKITGITAETVGKINDKKQQMQGLLSELTNLVTSGMDTVNNGVSYGLDNIQQNMQINQPNFQQPIVGGGLKELINIQHGGAQSAKRAYMSQVEFLKPCITSLQNYKKYIKNKNTRKQCNQVSRKSSRKN